ncbi:MAG: FHA domain-containing protein [Lachnospiraceae bacterium]
MDFYELMSLAETIQRLASVFMSMSWVVIFLAALGIYLFTGYTYMCIGKKAGIEGDWKPFIPIARQLYMMEITERPWWNIFLFGESATIIGVITALVSWIVLGLTKNLVAVTVILCGYAIAVMVFTFLYYRDFFGKFRFNPNTAWLTVIPGMGIIATVFKMMIAFSDVIVTNDGYIEDREGGVIPREPAVLRGLAGEYTGFTFDVSDGSEIVMGRDASVCQIVFNQFQSKVSRLHCKIHYDAKTDNYYVTNYSATSGTFTENGTRFEEGTAKLVARGTIIYLGDKANSFRLE